MAETKTEVTRSEHRALVFRMNRKLCRQVARYLEDHSGAPEAIFAVDVDSLELILQAKNAQGFSSTHNDKRISQHSVSRSPWWPSRPCPSSAPSSPG